MTRKPCDNPRCSKKTLNARFCSRSCAEATSNAEGPKRERTRLWKRKTFPVIYSPLDWGRKRCRECLRANEIREANVSAIRRDNQLRNGLRLGVCQGCGSSSSMSWASTKRQPSRRFRRPIASESTTSRSSVNAFSASNASSSHPQAARCPMVSGSFLDSVIASLSILPIRPDDRRGLDQLGRAQRGRPLSPFRADPAKRLCHAFPSSADHPTRIGRAGATCNGGNTGLMNTGQSTADLNNYMDGRADFLPKLAASLIFVAERYTKL